jgi:hypothetical protein
MIYGPHNQYVSSANVEAVELILMNVDYLPEYHPVVICYLLLLYRDLSYKTYYIDKVRGYKKCTGCVPKVYRCLSQKCTGSEFLEYGDFWRRPTNSQHFDESGLL